MRKSALSKAKTEITRYFDSRPNKIFRLTEVADILNQEKAAWKLPPSLSKTAFTDFLTEHGRFKRLTFPFPYRAEHRYIWGDVSIWEVLLSLKTNSYFTHQTAMQMHGLTDTKPSTIYINYEQPPHSQNSTLEQHRIDAAFNRKPRTSKNRIRHEEYEICLINGMHTGGLGVISQNISFEGSKGISVRLTGIERTLIDITVRPAYAGGVDDVLVAYKSAKARTSVSKLISILASLNYIYPYHQAIGFYLERAGYKATDINPLKKLNMDFNFYLAHNMTNTVFNPDWRLYIPKHMA